MADNLKEALLAMFEAGKLDPYAGNRKEELRKLVENSSVEELKKIFEGDDSFFMQALSQKIVQSHAENSVFNTLLEAGRETKRDLTGLEFLGMVLPPPKAEEEIPKNQQAYNAGVIRLTVSGIVKASMGVEIHHLIRHNGTNPVFVFSSLFEQVQATASKEVKILACTVTLKSGYQHVIRPGGMTGVTVEEMYVSLASLMVTPHIQSIVGVAVTGTGWQEHFQITEKLAYSFKGVPGKDHREILPGGEVLLGFAELSSKTPNVHVGSLGDTDLLCEPGIQVTSKVATPKFYISADKSCKEALRKYRKKAKKLGKTIKQ